MVGKAQPIQTLPLLTSNSIMLQNGLFLLKHPVVYGEAINTQQRVPGNHDNTKACLTNS